jgi:type II secretory pathway component HofQ
MNSKHRLLFRTAIAVCLFAVFWPLISSIGHAQEETIRYLNLDQADVRAVLRYLAEVSGMNIVADHDIEGEVSLHLKEVTWRQALEALLSSQGLTSRETDGFIRVMTMETFYDERLKEYDQAKQQENLVSLERMILKVEHATAKDIKESVETLLSERGRIGIDQRTNSLIVKDVPSKLSVIEKAVRTLDTQTPQITIETKLVELNSRTLSELGIDWTAVTSSGEILEFLGAKTMLDTSGVANIVYGTLGTDVSLDAVLKAVDTKNLGEVVGLPQITVVENKQGYIFMGERVPLTTVDFAGNVVVRMEEVGTQLAVTPHITQEKQILLELRPERSAVTEIVPGVGYRMSTQRAETEVLVNDGETAVIGGLRTSEETTLNKGIPILKDIPLIGRLFKYTREEITEKDLIIFVTPNIVK